MKEQILEEIRRIAGENGGRAPGMDTFARETGIKPHAWRGIYWVRWSDAIKEVGLDANPLNARTDDSILLTLMARAVRHLGKVPTEDELRLYCRDHESSSGLWVTRRLGGKAKALERLREFASSNDDFADIIATLPKGVSEESPQPRSELKEGYVYLVRSGAFYKIGKSNEIERRIKEIRVAQPEAADLVHAIRTDDPSGIEAYWHKRFADRRANGEWFRLTSRDVAAFKRRKYQ